MLRQGDVYACIYRDATTIDILGLPTPGCFLHMIRSGWCLAIARNHTYSTCRNDDDKRTTFRGRGVKASHVQRIVAMVMQC